jgi:thioredoxin reductase
MTRTIVIGDGPGGLSAALFLSKNGIDVDVYGKDQTAMHYAYLHNYLGIDEISGSDLQARGRSQATAAGAAIHDDEVTSVTTDRDGVSATLESGERIEADYLILSEGKNPVLARSLGLDEDNGAILVDQEGRTSEPRVYVIGRSARPARSQAIISAGDGAKAAIDILSREAGKDVQDWDSPPKA